MHQWDMIASTTKVYIVILFNFLNGTQFYSTSRVNEKKKKKMFKDQKGIVTINSWFEIELVRFDIDIDINWKFYYIVNCECKVFGN